MKHGKPLVISAQALLKGGATLEQNFENYKKEKILKFSGSFQTAMAGIPEERKLIILIDIVGFSKSTTREQVQEIYLFQRYLVSQVISNKISFRTKIHISQFIPTGDGCYIVADECGAETALEFLVALIGGFKEIKTDSEQVLALRASALIGTCVPIIDVANHKNYVGDGMNEASRILSGGQGALEKRFLAEHPEASAADARKYSRNSLYLGDSLAAPAETFAEDCAGILFFADLPDKHGKTRNVTILHGIL